MCIENFHMNVITTKIIDSVHAEYNPDWEAFGTDGLNQKWNLDTKIWFTYMQIELNTLVLNITAPCTKT